MGNDTNALIVFVDMRGFTSWAEKVDNFNFIGEFIKEWNALLKNSFSDGYAIKYLGDGAMLLKKIGKDTNEAFLQTLLSDTLAKIKNAKTSFGELCNQFSITRGSKIPLHLGWGIVKGTVKKIGNEYIGSEINKCSRYCDIARPHGIVIDATDFQDPIIPEDLGLKLYKQTRMLKGINENSDVWVTEEIYTQFLTREELRQSPEVHVAGICFKREKGRSYVLLGKRKLSRSLYPGLYEGCGGQLARDELFKDGVRRHYRLEYKIDVEVVEDEHVFYSIAEPNEPLIPGISFLCKYIEGAPESENHEAPTPKWFSEGEFNEIPDGDFIKGVKSRVSVFWGKFDALRNEEGEN